jgi:hypothetical protein
MPIELASSAQACAPASAKSARQRIRRCRFGCRETGLDHLTGQTGTQRADDRAAARVAGTDPLRDAGLAVGAGDRNQRQALTRPPVDGVRQRSAKRAQTDDRQIGDSPGAVPGEISRAGSRRLPEDGSSAVGDGLGDVAAAIGKVAGIGQKQVAGKNLAAVVRDTLGTTPSAASRAKLALAASLRESRLRAHSLALGVGAFGLCATTSGHVRRNAEGPQGASHDGGKHRCRNIATIVFAGTRLVDHHRDDQARIRCRAQNRRKTRRTCWHSDRRRACAPYPFCRPHDSRESAPWAPFRLAEQPFRACCAPHARSSG